MSLRMAARKRTICEVLREICDLHQSQTDHDKTIRKKLFEAEKMAKKMSKKLLSYNKFVYKGWWKQNPDYEQDVQRRLNKRYITK